MHLFLGFLLALTIGIGCRWFAIPLPAPASLVGALLILTATIGYVGTDKLIALQKAIPPSPSISREPPTGAK